MPLFSQPKQLIGYWGNEGASERFSTIPVTTGSPYALRSIIAVKVPGIQAGDFFEFYAGFQVECLHPYTTVICSLMQVSSDNDDVAGIEIAEANGRNIKDVIPKYEPRDRHGIWLAPANYDFRYFNLIIYAASTAAAAGDVMSVKSDYGRGYVKQYR